MASRKEINEMIMDRKELMEFARSLDENHPEYDSIWATILFVNGDANATAEMVRDARNAGAIVEREVPKYEAWLSEWELRDGTAE